MPHQLWNDLDIDAITVYKRGDWGPKLHGKRGKAKASILLAQTMAEVEPEWYSSFLVGVRTAICCLAALVCSVVWRVVPRNLTWSLFLQAFLICKILPLINALVNKVAFDRSCYLQLRALASLSSHGYVSGLRTKLQPGNRGLAKKMVENMAGSRIRGNRR